jgi:cell division septation protein DedD
VQVDKDAPAFVYVEKDSKQGFDIIAGFYLNKNTAAKMTARLHELGCDAYIIEKNDMFYVSMGSAPTRTKAEALYNHIKSWYDGDIVIKEL